MVDASRFCDIEVSRAVSGHTLHALNLVGKRPFWHRISLVLNIEELNGQISVQIDDGSIVQEVVKVLLLKIALALHDQVLWENIWCISALEHRVLSVILKVPRDNEKASVGVIDDEKLN